jgi:type I site-specific restriction-modification system R (restriction) subunit
MLRNLLDTNICIYVIKERPRSMLEIFNRHGGHMAISAITLAELLHGVEKSAAPERNLAVEAQPEAWQVLHKNHGAKAEATLLQRVRQQLDQIGTLDLVRHGVEVLGLPKALRLAEFKPAFGLNPAILARYNANRLRVVRQVRYSTRNENCLDLVLFLNGIPVATAELKTDNTQTIADAVWQYKTDRLSMPIN